jgi:ATP-dependent DNA helicase RecG
MKKNFIIEHIKKHRRGYAKELSDAKSELTPKDINNLLQELKKEGKIKHIGSRRTGYWELVIK